MFKIWEGGGRSQRTLRQLVQLMQAHRWGRGACVCARMLTGEAEAEAPMLSPACAKAPRMAGGSGVWQQTCVLQPFPRLVHECTIVWPSRRILPVAVSPEQALYLDVVMDPAGDLELGLDDLLLAVR